MRVGFFKKVWTCE